MASFEIRAEPRNIRETDQPFPEPALFLLNPDGEVVVIDYSNSPFARPDLRILVEGASLLTHRLAEREGFNSIW